jgi:hypothetical protein
MAIRRATDPAGAHDSTERPAREAASNHSPVAGPKAAFAGYALNIVQLTAMEPTRSPMSRLPTDDPSALKRSFRYGNIRSQAGS